MGLATADEEAVLDRMRHLHPELESEISVVAYKLQQASMAGGVTPPAEVWETISRKVKWEPRHNHRSKRRELPRYTVINLREPPRRRYMQVNLWWRCVFVGLCMLLVVLLAVSIYFYNKYHQLEDKLLRSYPTTQQPPSLTK